MAVTRVLICDDHPVYRQGLAHALRRRFDLVGEAVTGDEALERIRELHPDVAVLDMKMPGLDGMDVMTAVMRDGIATRVLFLSGYLHAGTVYEAVEAGAAGYLSKSSDVETICDAVGAVARGETVLGNDAQSAIRAQIRERAPSNSPHLTPREQEVLRLTAAGLSAADVAARLYLSAATVKTHLQRIYQKLGVSDRAAAVAEAMRRGMFD